MSRKNGKRSKRPWRLFYATRRQKHKPLPWRCFVYLINAQKAALSEAAWAKEVGDTVEVINIDDMTEHGQFVCTTTGVRLNRKELSHEEVK